MPVLAIIFLIYCFLKTFYYGIFELKTKKNKPGGIVVCIYSILRASFSIIYNNFLLHLLVILPYLLAILDTQEQPLSSLRILFFLLTCSL